MPHEPLVTVIVPTYNRAYCIERTLDSVLTQTYRRIELLVVDDGSTDGTAELLARRYAGEPRLRCITKENGGVSTARNRGLDEARGDCVAFLDSDDVWLPWKVAMQVAALERFPDLGMVWTDMEGIDPDGQTFDPRYIRAMYSAYDYFEMDAMFPRSVPIAEFFAPDAAWATARLHIGQIFSNMIAGNLVHTSTVMLRRSRLEQVGRFNEAWRSGEDYDFHLRTCRLGPVGFLDVPSIRYQRGMPDALTRRQYRVMRATNFLGTILPYITRHRAEILLSDRMIDTVLADAYGWLADAEFQAGLQGPGRQHALESLRRRPAQGRLALLLLASFLPGPLRAAVRRAWRALRGRGPVAIHDDETVGVASRRSPS